jgi:hypothetical protein
MGVILILFYAKLQKHQNCSLMQLLTVPPELVLEHLIVSAVLWQQCQRFTDLKLSSLSWQDENKQQDPTSIFTIPASM